MTTFGRLQRGVIEMTDNTKYILTIATLLAVAVLVVLIAPQGREGKSSKPRADAPNPAGAAMHTAGLDPASPSPIARNDNDVTSDEVGPEEFYFSLASALTGEGFTEEYIAAISRLYGGHDPSDFLTLDAASLAGQLGQHMMDEYGYQYVTTNDAADVLRVAREVYGDLES